MDLVEPTTKALDKGKGKAVGIQINELQALPRKPIQPSMLDLEKVRKEKEDLAKELEKVENEAQATETRRKIQFIKSNFALASWPNLSIPPAILAPVSGPIISTQGIPQSAPTSSSTIGTQVPFVPPQQSQAAPLSQANIARYLKCSWFLEETSIPRKV